MHYVHSSYIYFFKNCVAVQNSPLTTSNPNITSGYLIFKKREAPITATWWPISVLQTEKGKIKDRVKVREQRGKFGVSRFVVGVCTFYVHRGEVA